MIASPIFQDVPEPVRALPFAGTPLLAGPLARAAREAVDDIVCDLLELPPERRYCRFAQAVRPTLGALEPWISLLFAYYAEGTGVEMVSSEVGELSLEQRALAVLDEAQAQLIGNPRLDLYNGWCGFGWALSHLTEATEGDDLVALDAAVEAVLVAPQDFCKLDLIGGVVGYGIYLLERLPRPAAERGLRALVDQLESQAEHTEGGLVTWWTRPEVMHERERVAAGVYNLGLAHGIPGVVGLLARIHRAGIAQRQCRALLVGVLPWLLRQQLPVVGESRLPRHLTAGETPEPCRIAWCYGELGAALPMLLAARELGDAVLEGRVIDLALHAARVTGPPAGVIDPGLCHGAAGNGHIFHRLYRATGEEALRQAAVFWIERTLEYRRPGTGLGGFQSCYPGRSERPWADDASFIMGSTGIGLALLAAVTSDEPAWDQLLMLS